jgi:hypothetical protein
MDPPKPREALSEGALETVTVSTTEAANPHAQGDGVRPDWQVVQCPQVLAVEALRAALAVGTDGSRRLSGDDDNDLAFARDHVLDVEVVDVRQETNGQQG